MKPLRYPLTAPIKIELDPPPLNLGLDIINFWLSVWRSLHGHTLTQHRGNQSMFCLTSSFLHRRCAGGVGASSSVAVVRILIEEKRRESSTSEFRPRTTFFGPDVGVGLLECTARPLVVNLAHTPPPSLRLHPRFLSRWCMQQTHSR